VARPWRNWIERPLTHMPCMGIISSPLRTLPLSPGYIFSKRSTTSPTVAPRRVKDVCYNVVLRQAKVLGPKYFYSNAHMRYNGLF